MFDYSDYGISLTTQIDSRRASSNGLYLVRVRVTHKRTQRYYSTGKYLSLEDWEKLPTAKSKALTDIKREIQNTAGKVEACVKDLIKNDMFSFETLNKRLGNATGDTLNTAFEARVEELTEQGKISTSDLYKYTHRSIKLFAGDKIKFSQVTIEWLKQFEAFLLKEEKSYTTVSMFMRTLQVVINSAKEAGIIKATQHPFGKGKYEIPQHEGRNIALTLSQISQIVNYKCVSDNEEKCRDFWFFSYLCNGANITDICKLKFSNLRSGDLCFYRQKTLGKAKKKKLIYALVTPEMQAIIKRWGNQSGKLDEYIFPFLKGGESPTDERRIIKNITHLMNDKMKVIGEKLGIGGISTYTARHSYASVLKRSGANIAFISESLGHNDLKTTENYLASFEQEERVRNAALLTKF